MLCLFPWGYFFKMVYVNLTDHIRRMSATAKAEGKFKCVICGKNAITFVVARPFCKEHSKIEKAKYHHNFHKKYYPEHSDKIKNNALDFHNKNYIPSPRVKLSKEELRQNANKRARERYKEIYIPHPRKKVPESQIIRNAEMRIARRMAKYFLNRKEICKERREAHKKKVEAGKL